MPDHYNVLFLCTGNSARSIMAEAILNHKAKASSPPTVRAAIPSGAAGPEALKQIESAGISDGRSAQQVVGRVRRPDAPKMNFVFTVCDNAAKEAVPLLAGPADDRALGHSRSGGRERHARGNRARLSRRLHDSRPQNRSVPLAASRDAENSPSSTKSTRSADR